MPPGRTPQQPTASRPPSSRESLNSYQHMSQPRATDAHFFRWSSKVPRRCPERAFRPARPGVAITAGESDTCLMRCGPAPASGLL